METLTTLGYLLAALLFIFGMRRLRSPATAKSGNLMAAVGMLIAVIVTLVESEVLDLVQVGGGVALGTVVGVVSARRVAMTDMPQMVAAFNGVGGGAAALIGYAELDRSGETVGLVILLAIVLSILVGGVAFAGSAIAFIKLQGLALEDSVSFKGQGIVNAIVFLVALAAGVYIMAGGSELVLAAGILLGAALVLGVLLTIPIGGADMPIVISLLNAFTGLAAAMSGFTLANDVLIIAGSLVGASGIILTRLMSGALGRPLGKIIFGSLGGGAGKGERTEREERPVRSVGAEDVAALLNYDADSVVIVPGYGLAVAQAQKATADLVAALEADGKQVRFAIHPVAGRMPGHMNVLLAEADIGYDKMIDLEDINDDFGETDVAIVVGANDVVNPSAREEGDSPISGMPILNVDHARQVVFIKRSLSPGFAGIDNPLFYDEEKTMMLFSDAKDGLEGITSAVKST